RTPSGRRASPHTRLKPGAGSTRRSEAPPSGSYDRSRYVRLHTYTTIGGVRIYFWCADLKGASVPGRSREHQDDKVFGESVRLQSPLNIRTKLSGERASTISLKHCHAERANVRQHEAQRSTPFEFVRSE